MTSDRNKADLLLDAARASILSVGWKRTTLTDVARRAGVSRMTIYRTWPDMPALFGDLMTREWAHVLGPDPAATVGEDAADDIARLVVQAVGSLRDNALFRRILDVDPELLLPYLVDRPGRTQQVVLDLLAPTIAAGQVAGRLRDGDPQILARTLLLGLHGHVISQSTMTDDGISPDQLDDELHELVRRYLAR